MISVYIASPYTKGDVADNVRVSMLTASKLIDDGFFPYCPLLAHFLHMQNPKDYNVWMRQDLYWLSKCNCVLRLPGESSGADMEVNTAIYDNMKVFFKYDDLKNYWENYPIILCNSKNYE